MSRLWAGALDLESMALPTGVREPRLSARAVGTMCRAQQWGGCSAPRADLKHQDALYT